MTDNDDRRFQPRHPKGGNPNEWPDDLRAELSRLRDENARLLLDNTILRQRCGLADVSQRLNAAREAEEGNRG